MKKCIFKSLTLWEISLFLLLITASAAIVFFVTASMRTYAVKNAENMGRTIIEHNLATHRYFNEVLKPRLYKELIDVSDPDFFDPVFMSSTFAVGKIEEICDGIHPNRYVYKRFSAATRNRKNEPDDLEKKFLEELKTDPDLHQRSVITKTAGEPYLTLLQRGEAFSQFCQKCHGSPEAAPGELVEIYGPVRGFHKTSEDWSAISLRIPLAASFEETQQVAIKLSTILLTILLVLFGLQRVLSRKLIFAPLENLNREFRRIASHPEHLGETIPSPLGMEMCKLVDTFNAMSRKLKKEKDNLEQNVQERTAELKKSHEITAEIMRRNEVILATAKDGIFGLDKNGRTVFVNPAAEKITGWSRAELLGNKHHSLVHHSTPDGKTYPEDECPVHRCLHTGTSFENLEDHFVHKNGRVFPVEISCAAIREGESCAGVVVTFRDITERRQSEEKIRQMAFTDQLTGVPNRHLFNDRLAQALAQARRERSLIAVLYIDLDDFKEINDAYGHGIGDRYLKEIAIRISDCLRETDTVARFGGDEFVCFGKIQQKKDAAILAERILQNLSRSIRLEKIDHWVSASIGVAVYPQDGETINALIKEADRKMYQVKKDGKDRYFI